MVAIIKAGFYTSIQDSGRYNYRNYGVPLSGVMDRYSCTFANLLLGNKTNASVIEITMTGPILLFTKPTIICISGAEMHPKLNGLGITMNTPIIISENDTLSFGKLKAGLRAYIAVKDGFQSEYVLNSYSMYDGITEKTKLNKGDAIPYKAFEKRDIIKNATVKYKHAILTQNTLEAYAAPEFDCLNDTQKQLLFNFEFIVSKYNNRMAYRLDGFAKNKVPSILTSGVLPGTVQLTPYGELIVLMRDGQTTGGYPRVLQLTEASISVLSQKATNAVVRFRVV